MNACVEPDPYPEQLVNQIRFYVEQNDSTEFYLFRHPEAPLPMIRTTNVIHKVSELIPWGRLYLVDTKDMP